MKIKSSFSMWNRSLIVAILVFAAAIGSANAEDLLKRDFPDRYTVKKGDTLWDISGMFLNKPWRWPEIWQANDQIANPHLIFPGEVLVLTFIDGRPVLRRLGNEKLGSNGEVLKLSPSIRESELGGAIPPISPGAIRPFLTAPLVTDEDELSTAPYIVEGVEQRLLAGAYDDVYVRGLDTKENEKFRIFRGGRKFFHPETRELLGYEAVHVGDSYLKKFGDTSRVGVTNSHLEVAVLDRLRAVNESSTLPYFFPRSHNDLDIKGYILAPPNRSLELGSLNVVALTLGSRENVEEGHVFRVVSAPKPRVDPLTKQPYLLPSESSGLAMVFRVFDKISYAILLDRERVIEPGDLVVHPDTLVPTNDSDHPLNLERKKVSEEGSRIKKWWFNKRHGKYGETPSIEGSEKYIER